MVLRKKNLLEAFQASAPEGRKAQARSRPEPVSSGGPFAPTAPGSAGDRQLAPRRSALARTFGDRTVQLAIAVVLVAVGGAYWMGKKSAVSASAPPASQAAGALRTVDGNAPPPASPAGTAALNRQTAELTTAEDQALMNKANEYTIRLIQYSNDDAGLKKANATYDYLRRKEAVPVVSPIIQGKIIVLVAGATPRIKDLDTLIAYVRALKGPIPKDGVLPFQDAYVVNIDDLVARP